MATYESKKYSIPGGSIRNIAATAVADGSVTDAEYQFINTLGSNAQTQIDAKLPLAGGSLSGNISLADDIKARFGAGNDLEIYHSNSGSADRIESDNTLQLRTDNIEIQNAAGTENMISGIADGAVSLLHNNSTKIATTSTGATVSGTLSATTFSGSGASLSSLNASNLSSGTVAEARLPAAALADSDYQKLSTVSLSSNSSQLGFLGPSSGFSSSFRHYKVLLHGKWQNMSNSASYLALRVSTNNSSYISSNIYHFTHLFMSTNASNFTYYGGGNSAHYFSRWNPYGNQGSKTMSSEITIFGINDIYAHKAFTATGGSWDRSQAADVHYNLSGGTINTTSTIRGIQLFHADGANISAYAGATLYGIK